MANKSAPLWHATCPATNQRREQNPIRLQILPPLLKGKSLTLGWPLASHHEAGFFTSTRLCLLIIHTCTPHTRTASMYHKYKARGKNAAAIRGAVAETQAKVIHLHALHHTNGKRPSCIATKVFPRKSRVLKKGPNLYNEWIQVRVRNEFICVIRDIWAA